MTIEQIQKLSEATEIASSTNNIKLLKKIWELIQNDKKINGANEEGSEWFFALITSNQANAINVK